jgi:hypothetical protein
MKITARNGSVSKNSLNPALDLADLTFGTLPAFESWVMKRFPLLIQK